VTRFALLAALAGCAASPEAIGWLDDRPLTYADVARHLRTRDPEAFRNRLEALVLERITRAEAARLGASVPPAVLERATAKRLAEWEASVEKTSEFDPDTWLAAVAGVERTEFAEWIRRHTETELLQDRLLRYETLSSPRREVSVLVVAERDLAERLTERAARTDFAALAQRHSVHPSAPMGGRIPFPLLADDVEDARIRAALFEADAGAVVGPFPAPQGLFQLYRVAAAGDPAGGSYAALAPEVERDLEARPVHVGEYERWRRRVLLRHGFVAARAPESTR